MRAIRALIHEIRNTLRGLSDGQDHAANVLSIVDRMDFSAENQFDWVQVNRSMIAICGLRLMICPGDFPVSQSHCAMHCPNSSGVWIRDGIIHQLPMSVTATVTATCIVSLLVPTAQPSSR